MLKKKLFAVGGSLVLSFGLAGAVAAQDSTTTTTTTTVKQTVQNADGTYTVVEYPVGKDVMVDLTPGTNMSNAKGMAHITRAGDTTTVNLDLSGLPSDASNYYVYAVDPSGAVTLLGPADIADGMSKATFTTPLNKFMLVLSPTENLSTIGNDTVVTFRSSVPKGYAVVPVADRKARTMRTDSAYDVPLLGIPGFKNGTTKISIKNFSGKLASVKGEAYITPTKGGSTKIIMGFGNMKLGPANTRYVLWAVSPDKKYTKIGQAIATGENDHSEIRGETILPDFGLFVTAEDTDVEQPTSTIYSIFGYK